MARDRLAEIPVIFYRTAAGAEPVRDWLRGLSAEDRRIIGTDLATVQAGWPSAVVPITWFGHVGIAQQAHQQSDRAACIFRCTRSYRHCAWLHQENSENSIVGDRTGPPADE